MTHLGVPQSSDELIFQDISFFNINILILMNYQIQIYF